MRRRWLMILIASIWGGCGRDEVVPLDGTPPAPDASTAGSITITTQTVCCLEPPMVTWPGVPVHVTQPDGTPGPSGTTDAGGQLTLDGVLPGATVSAIYVEATDHKVFTVLGVEPGDHLVIGDKYYQWASGSGFTPMTISWPPISGAFSLEVLGPGFSYWAPDTTSTSVSLGTNCGCIGPIQFLAYDDYGQLLASGVLRDVVFDGSPVALPAWLPPVPVEMTLSDLDPSVDWTYLDAITTVGTFGEIASTYAIPSDGGAAATFLASDDTDRIDLVAVQHRPGFGVHLEHRAVAPDATTESFTDSGLPWLGAVTIDSASQSAGWVQDSGVVPGDGAIVRCDWARGETSDEAHYWTVLIPPGTHAWTWGSFPAEVIDELPGGTDVASCQVTVLDLDGVADYAALRATPTWITTTIQPAVDAGDLAGASLARADDWNAFPGPP